MKKPQSEFCAQLLLNISNGGEMNFHEWVELILDNFSKE